MSDFEAAASTTARTLVHEMFLPAGVPRTVAAATGLGGVAGGEKFLYQGIFFKLVRESELYVPCGCLVDASLCVLQLGNNGAQCCYAPF